MRWSQTFRIYVCATSFSNPSKRSQVADQLTGLLGAFGSARSLGTVNAFAITILFPRLSQPTRLRARTSNIYLLQPCLHLLDGCNPQGNMAGPLDSTEKFGFGDDS